MKQTVRNLSMVLALITIGQASSLFAQDIVIDGTGKTQDDILMDLMIEADDLNGKTIQINNFIYEDFGTRTGKVRFYQSDPWFKDPMTFNFYKSDSMYSYSFNYCFQPNTADGKKYSMKMNTLNYTSPKEISVKGRFVKHTLNTGKVLYFFLVEELTILEKTYTGSIPSRITE